MKRSLLLAAVLAALLWIRQIRFERRMARRQGVFERETARNVASVIKDGAESWNRWGNRLIDDIESGFRRVAGGARR